MECIRRKLIALNYPQVGINAFNPKDVNVLKNFILWLEDQHIRFYKIEDRENLCDIGNSNWISSLDKYLKDLKCPFTHSETIPMLDWILGYAVRLNYADNVETYSKVDSNAINNDNKKEQTASGIQHISVNDPDFRNGVGSLAKILEIPLHEDYFLTLKAIQKFVQKRLTEEATINSKSGGKISTVSLDKMELGLNLKDPELNEAACALRLLYINDLREFQTKINQAIVSVQNITANPKTNQALGRVGR